MNEQSSQPPPDNTPLIELKDVSFRYGREWVLQQINLTIRPEDYLLIIGPNGGGKSTLLKIILGLLKPDKGRVIYHARNLGYVPQYRTFEENFPLRVREVVRSGLLKRKGWFRTFTPSHWKQVDETLERLNLLDLREHKVGELSGGQLQRVLIARALVADPDVLFLDEPTASIDSGSRENLNQLLDNLSRRIPIVLITHDLSAVSPRVRQIGCINRQFYLHAAGEVTSETLEAVYGCPVELIAHGVPHRVLHIHNNEHGKHHHG